MSARERMMSLRRELGLVLPDPVNDALDRHCENLSQALAMIEATNPSQEMRVQHTERIIAIYATELRQAIYNSTGQLIEDQEIRASLP